MDTFDVVVVGAGSAGVPLAARLSEDPSRKVLLLEAGPDYRSVEETPAEMLGRHVSEAKIEHDWQFMAEAVPGRMVDYPAGKVVGGSSAINSAVALRGAPDDYDEWAELTGEPSWSYQQFLPFLKRLENDGDFQGPLHGDSGPIPVRRPRPEELVHVHAALARACRAAGYAEVNDHNDPGQSGVGPWPMNVRDGIRISTALGYLTPEVRARQNLTILSMAKAHRVLIDTDHAVTGVEFEIAGSVKQIHAARVVLAAGAISTPGILLRSGIGPAATLSDLGIPLRVDSPKVGEGLQDHPFTWLAAVPKGDICNLPQRSVQIGLRYTAPDSPARNDMQLMIVIPVDISHSPTLVERVGTDRIFMIGAGLQKAYSRGQLQFTSADPDIPPRIELGIGTDERDMRRMRDGLRLAWSLLHSGEFDDYLERVALFDPRWLADDVALDDYIRGNVITFKHPVGTAAMGAPDPAKAVVDARGQVNGVTGLLVGDASLMPTIPRSNTNVTCIALGERLASWLADSGGS